MCLSIPAEVVALNNDGSDMATVNVSGVKKQISLALVEDVAVGDFVIVHVGYALQKLDIGEAEKTFVLMADIGFHPAVSGSFAAAFG
jgi:hydrogenase expression/formation protein HypC